MAMGIMYNRLGELDFHNWRMRTNDATTKYFYTSNDGRLVEHDRGHYDFSIEALPKWEHRFIGVTATGLPIWVKKRTQYKYSGGQINHTVMPKDPAEVFTSDKHCKTEELTSYITWRRGKKKLAFIYLGIFWRLEAGETLKDAAKRFILAHPEVEEVFNARMERKGFSLLGESCIERRYLIELFEDGALIFKDDEAIIERENFFNYGLWAIMVAEGFFAKEGIKRVQCVNEIDC